MRIDKYLADMGCGTRKEIKEKIKKGLVCVGGEVIKDPGLHVSEEDNVTLAGEPVSYSEYVYYMLNKPAGVVSATRDDKEKTVIDLLSEDVKRKDIYPVGRLDKDTVGLLLITNDGELAHRLLSPAHHVPKRYFARVKGRLSESDIGLFEKGLDIGDEDMTMPAKLEIKSTGEYSEAEVVITEGRFHQVKRMFAAVDTEVVFLKRLSMGGLTLDDALQEGEYRELTQEELKTIISV